MNKVIGDNIKRYRETRNLSQEHIGEILGMTQSNYARYEKGEAKLRLDQAITLANHLGVTVNDLMESRTGMVNEDQRAYLVPNRNKASIILELDGTHRAEEKAILMVREINKALKESV